MKNMDELEYNYLNTLKTFNFEIRIDDEDVFKRYYVYGDDYHYTNIHNLMGDIKIHINQKSSPKFYFDELKYNELLKDKTFNIKPCRNYEGNIHTITIITEITKLYKVLNILYGEKLRVDKIKRLIK